MTSYDKPPNIIIQGNNSINLGYNIIKLGIKIFDASSINEALNIKQDYLATAVKELLVPTVTTNARINKSCANVKDEFAEFITFSDVKERVYY